MTTGTTSCGRWRNPKASSPTARSGWTTTTTTPRARSNAHAFASRCNLPASFASRSSSTRARPRRTRSRFSRRKRPARWAGSFTAFRVTLGWPRTRWIWGFISRSPASSPSRTLPCCATSPRQSRWTASSWRPTAPTSRPSRTVANATSPPTSAMSPTKSRRFTASARKKSPKSRRRTQSGSFELNKSRVLSPHYPDVLRPFRRRRPADSAAGSSAPPGAHAAPPAQTEPIPARAGVSFDCGLVRALCRSDQARFAPCDIESAGTREQEAPTARSRSESLQLSRFLSETLRQLLGIAFLLRITAGRLLLVRLLLPGEGPRSRHLQPRLELTRRQHCAAVGPGEVADLMIRRHDRAVGAVPFCQPLDNRIGRFPLPGIDDLETLAPFGPLDRMPGPPAVKDDRHGMALALAIARQVTDQCLPLGFHVAPQAPSHPKQVVAVDDETDRHEPSV